MTLTHIEELWCAVLDDRHQQPMESRKFVVPCCTPTIIVLLRWFCVQVLVASFHHLALGVSSHPNQIATYARRPQPYINQSPDRRLFLLFNKYNFTLLYPGLGRIVTDFFAFFYFVRKYEVRLWIILNRVGHAKSLILVPYVRLVLPGQKWTSR